MTVDSQKDAGPATIINSGNGMVTTAGSSRSKEWKEWFPSVSATIGDRYPERNIFQIFIALTCPPRLFLLGGWYYLCMSSPSSVGKTNRVPLALFVIGFLRTVTCGGWVYVTSGDDHDVHDVMMISYMLLTLPYMIMMIKTGSNRTLTSYVAPEDAKVSTRRRKIVCKLFFGIIPPMIWFFIRHKVHKIPG
ncbi:Protein cwh43, partial [Spiromyces aspiralis]